MCLLKKRKIHKTVFSVYRFKKILLFQRGKLQSVVIFFKFVHIQILSLRVREKRLLKTGHLLIDDIFYNEHKLAAFRTKIVFDVSARIYVTYMLSGGYKLFTARRRKDKSAVHKQDEILHQSYSHIRH